MTSKRRNRTTASGPRIRQEGGRRIVSARHAGDLAGLVPALLGRDPEDCVVVVLFRGKRTFGGFRIGRFTGGDLAEWASQVVALACRTEGATGMAVLLYTPETFAPSGRPPGADQLRAVARRAARAGFEVKDRIVVAADGFGSIDDAGLPRGGRPLSGITDLGEGFAPDGRGAAPEIRDAPHAHAEVMADHLEQWWTLPEGPGGTLHGVRLQRYRGAFGPATDPDRSAMDAYRWGEHQADVVEVVEGMLEHHDPDGSPCPCRALLSALALREGLNSLVLVQWLWGPEVGRTIWASAHAADPSTSDLLGKALSGDHVRPELDRIDRAIDTVVATAALRPAGLRAPLLSMLAWLFWARGVNSVAAELVERALAAGGELDLARMVGRFLAAGQVPGWLFRADPSADPMRQLLAG